MRAATTFPLRAILSSSFEPPKNLYSSPACLLLFAGILARTILMTISRLFYPDFDNLGHGATGPRKLRALRHASWSIPQASPKISEDSPHWHNSDSKIVSTFSSFLRDCVASPLSLPPPLPSLISEPSHLFTQISSLTVRAASANFVTVQAC